MNRNYIILILVFLILNGCKNEPETIHGFEIKDSFCDEYKDIRFPDKIKTYEINLLGICIRNSFIFLQV